MKAANRGGSPGKGRQRSGAKPHGSVTDALREEAERGRAAEDRRAEDARRRDATKCGKGLSRSADPR
jgi:hypothetical protein